MDHEELKEKLLKGMGGKPPMVARESWGEFQRTKATEWWYNYEWIKIPQFHDWAHYCTDVDNGLGGSQGTTIRIMNFGRVGHDK
jgi:hypothetical protein